MGRLHPYLGIDIKKTAFYIVQMFDHSGIRADVESNLSPHYLDGLFIYEFQRILFRLHQGAVQGAAGSHD